MKIRQGFVSNSSSSSFLVLVTKDDYERLLRRCTDYQKEILNGLFNSQKIGTQDLYYLHEEIGTDAPESLNGLNISQEYELSMDNWERFSTREKAFNDAIDMFRGHPGILIREDY